MNDKQAFDSAVFIHETSEERFLREVFLGESAVVKGASGQKVQKYEPD